MMKSTLKRISYCLIGAVLGTASNSIAGPFDACKTIPVPVPSFSCADGVLVPKFITDGKCQHPEDLYQRCVVDSRLGVLSRGEGSKGVDIVYSCRKPLSMDPDQGSSGRGDQNALEFYDIAVIQYDRSNGNTCFYQYLDEPLNINKTLPAPATTEGEEFWGKFSNYSGCADCHTNNAFIRSPHYNFLLRDVYSVDAATISHHGMSFDISDRLLPDIYSTQKYSPLNTEKVKWVAREGNVCSFCHSIGARRQGNSLKLGDINRISTGIIGIHGADDGYDDFMVPKILQYLKNDCIPDGTGQDACTTWRRDFAKDAVTSLEACLGNSPPSDCLEARPEDGSPPRFAATSVTRPGRPADPKGTAGVQMKKAYASQRNARCLAPVGDSPKDGMDVKQVDCDADGFSKYWLFDSQIGLIRNSQFPEYCLAVRPQYVDKRGNELPRLIRKARDAKDEAGMREAIAQYEALQASLKPASYEQFEGSEPRYAYSSRTTLWGCDRKKTHLLKRWERTEFQTIRSVQKKEYCLSGDDSYSWSREPLTDSYVEPCARNSNGSFWILK